MVDAHAFDLGGDEVGRPVFWLEAQSVVPICVGLDWDVAFLQDRRAPCSRLPTGIRKRC